MFSFLLMLCQYDNCMNFFMCLSFFPSFFAIFKSLFVALVQIISLIVYVILVPIIYRVHRARDGNSFATRLVDATQHGVVTFTLFASFQVTALCLLNLNPIC